MVKEKEGKGLGTLQIILFTFSAVFVLDSLGLPLTFGWQSLIWWVVLGVAFFLPYGLITSELSTKYGTEGGIYVWTQRAFGDKMAARTNYFYWVNVAFWMPSVYLVLGDTVAYAINPDVLSNDWWIWASVGIAIVATWITVLVNLAPIENASWIPNISSILKMLLVVILVVSMIVFLSTGHEVQTDWSAPSSATPTLSPGFSIGIIGIILYNMCGFELGSNIEVKDVKKTMAKAIGIGGITIIASYIIASIPILVMTDVYGDDFVYTASLVSSLQWMTGGAQWFVILVSLILALTLFGNMTTWTLGANGAIVESSEDNMFVASFANKNKNGAPVTASMFLGIVSTVSIIFAGLITLIPGEVDLYYILFSFSLIIFFFPYLIIFLAFAKLRKKDKEKDDKIIKNNKLAISIGYWLFGITIIALIAQIFEVQFGATIDGTGGFIVIVPLPEMAGWPGIALTLVGIIATIGAGEYLIRKGQKNSNKNKDSKNDPKNHSTPIEDKKEVEDKVSSKEVVLSKENQEKIRITNLKFIERKRVEYRFSTS